MPRDWKLNPSGGCAFLQGRFSSFCFELVRNAQWWFEWQVVAGHPAILTVSTLPPHRAVVSNISTLLLQNVERKQALEAQTEKSRVFTDRAPCLYAPMLSLKSRAGVNMSMDATRIDDLYGLALPLIPLVFIRQRVFPPSRQDEPNHTRQNVRYHSKYLSLYYCRY